MSAIRLENLEEHVGTQVGESDWHEVDQERIDLFAAATDDHQWIHVDPDRARTGPYGATIAHGYLTLSLLPVLVQEAFVVDGVTRRINYGLDKVRFPAPVRVGSRIRAVVSVRNVERGQDTVQLGLRCVVEIDGGERPACVADTVTLLVI